MKVIGDEFLGRTDNIRTRECVGCGYCCAKTPCDASRRLYPGADHCPQLLWMEEDKRYKCSLMMIAGLVGEGYRKELYAGEGCCSGLNSWRKDVKQRDRLDRDNYWNPLDPIFQIFLKCFAANFISSDSIKLIIIQMAERLKLKGYSDKEIIHIQTTISQMFSQNQSSFMKGFMG
jgi:hypothetical protein